MRKCSDSYDHSKVGKRILQLRKSLGFTREEMAKAVGIAAKYYADIERGSCGMSVETLLAIRESLGVSLDYILLGEEKEENEDVWEEQRVIRIIHRLPSTERAYALKSMMLLAKAYTIREEEQKEIGEDR